MKLYDNILAERSKNLKRTTLYIDPERTNKLRVIAQLESKTIADIMAEAFDMLISTRRPIIKEVKRMKF